MKFGTGLTKMKPADLRLYVLGKSWCCRISPAIVKKGGKGTGGDHKICDMIHKMLTISFASSESHQIEA